MASPNISLPEEPGSRFVVLAPAPAAEETTPMASAGGLNFRYVAAVVRANLRVIAFIFAVVMALAVVVTLVQTPRYTAKTTVQINNASSRVLKNQSDDKQDDEEGATSTDTDRFLKTQVDIIKSRALALRVAQKLNLLHDTRLFKAEGASLPTPDLSPDALNDRVIGLLRGHTTVDLPRDSRVVSITVESTDPHLSADIANAYASEYIQSNLKRRFDSSSYARDFIASQLAEMKGKLEESERGLNTYSRQAGLIHMAAASGGDNKSAAQGGSVTVSSLMQVNQAANEAKARRIAAEARWDAIRAVPLLSASEVVSNMGINNLLGQKAQLEVALEDDRARHLDDYPTVRAKQAQLASINRQIMAVATSIRNAIQAEYKASVDAEAELNAQVNQLKTATLSEQDRDVQYNLLARDVDSNRQIYDSLLQRLKELNASAGITISNISIVDPADVPLLPSSPNLGKNLGVSLALALLLCTLTLVIKDQFDDSIRIPEDIETKLSLNLLGAIPQVVDGNPEAGLDDPKSPLSEAYNSLRSVLLHATSHGLPRTLLITSAQPAEGKSTTCYAIALSLARMGKKVLLIDGDLRRPSMHRRIDCDNEQGLSTLLSSQTPLETIVRPTDVPGFFVVPSGPVPPSPTEMLSSPRMRDVVQEACTLYDIVIIDSPPILGLADAPTMATIVEAVVFVVEADRSRHGSLKAAMRRLRAHNSNVVGGVLTKFDPLRRGNQYSYYYGYNYYQYQYQYKND
ncbi:MAG TPA: polysaccharide biosynthesis tyrosine autokinase [Novosphingobium sp.]|nr:polysaccharide biosynthesis tyrosine autokinase [Novosphingobium sp.]HZV10765.1 polysaccharide biosynthesis tyrosine autokinase [Novosphingobium sp.]